VNNNNIHINKIADGDREELRKILKVIKLCEEYGYNPSPNIYNWSLEELKASLENWSSRVYEELERQYDILKLCADYGIYYHPNKSGTQELLDSHIEDVELALKHFQKVSKNGVTIRNPQGWLIRCLAEGWWEKPIYGFGLNEFLNSISQFLPKNIPRDYS
jgi:hypothetical protein